ncbi:MAG: hypothetical protein EBU66_06165 [Bacteroidetes bacterium]|jgi:hypothetical protein|nr:hypothetical protein [bacterium]NBP64248.1 hypothetical protein [Bacteroidota bacterium]
MEKKELPPHPITLEGAEYIRTMTPNQKKLHLMAIQKLGSSYFVERAKGFLAWKASRKAQ